jgi:anhydro-N-acetylmuramic acid kinase
LRSVAQGERVEVRDLGRLSMLVTHDHEDAVRAVCEGAGITAGDLAFVAAHGVTISHDPGGDPPHSWQLLAGSALAARLGAVVVDGFRDADVALGGQGAPLAPISDLALRVSPDEDRAILNLGGIANVSLLGAGVERMTDVVAADVGPANLPLDLLRRRQTDGVEGFDADGSLALAGAADEDVLRTLLDARWVRASLPRSFGREEFGTPFVDAFLERAGHLSSADQMATLVALEAAALRVFLTEIAGSWRRRDDVPLGLYVTGGGRHNRAVMEALARDIPHARVQGIESLGVDADAKEAVDFALLGWRCLRGEPAGIFPVSGARADAVLGALHLPALVP